MISKLYLSRLNIVFIINSNKKILVSKIKLIYENKQ